MNPAHTVCHPKPQATESWWCDFKDDWEGFSVKAKAEYPRMSRSTLRPSGPLVIPDRRKAKKRDDTL